MTKRFDPDDSADFPPEWEALLPTPGELFKTLETLETSMGPRHAVLDESGNVQPATLMQWARWWEKNQAQRIIDRTDIADHSVSTVFLGLNHQHMPGRRPLWFETMIFAPAHEEYSEFFKKTHTIRDDLWMRRCTTRAEAIAMHKQGITWLEKYLHEKATKGQKED
jgi:hypothetical protein